METERNAAYRGWSDAGTDYACQRLDLEESKAREARLINCLIHLADRDWFKGGMKGEVICGLDAVEVRNALSDALDNLDSSEDITKRP